MAVCDRRRFPDERGGPARLEAAGFHGKLRDEMLLDRKVFASVQEAQARLKRSDTGTMRSALTEA